MVSRQPHIHRTPQTVLYTFIAGLILTLQTHNPFYIYTCWTIAVVHLGLLYLALQKFREGYIWTNGIMMEMAIAIIMATQSAVWLQESGHQIWPWGVTCGVCGLYIVYYCWYVYVYMYIHLCRILQSH